MLYLKKLFILGSVRFLEYLQINYISDDGEGKMLCHLWDFKEGGYLITIPNDFKEFAMCFVGVYANTSIKFKNNGIVLLEGDHTDKDITFFEGLKSVGQDTDEISVSSVNENLFEKFSQESTSVNNYYDKTTNTYYSSSRLSVESLYACVRVGGEDVFVGFENNGVAEISYRFDDNICNNFENAYINNEGIITKPTTLINSKNRKYLIIGFRTRINGSIATLKDLYINLKTDNGYVPYKSNKKEILYFNPTTQTWEKPVLREWDSIEKHSDGKYYYHKRSGEVVLDGSENWKLFNKQSTQVDISTFTFTLGGDKANSQLICDKFARKDYRLNEEFVYIGGTPTWIIGVSNSKIASQDVAGFKQWLQANPVTVVYQLAEEKVYVKINGEYIVSKLTIPLAYNGTMSISATKAPTRLY